MLERPTLARTLLEYTRTCQICEHDRCVREQIGNGLGLVHESFTAKGFVHSACAIFTYKALETTLVGRCKGFFFLLYRIQSIVDGGRKQRGHNSRRLNCRPENLFVASLHQAIVRGEQDCRESKDVNSRNREKEMGFLLQKSSFILSEGYTLMVKGQYS